MNITRRLLVFAFPAFCLLAGCTSASEPKEINPDAFSSHFAAQAQCKAYVDQLVTPAAMALKAMQEPEEMRTWFDSLHAGEFATVVQRVRAATAEIGQIDPRDEGDQRKVSARVFNAMQTATGFKSSSCGPDVHEHVMEALYLGVGGEKSPVAIELARRGIRENREQRWVLLTTLLAGSLRH